MTDIPAYSRARGLIRNDGEPYDVEDILDLVDDQRRHLDALEKELDDVKATIATQRMMAPALWERVVALGFVAGSGNPVVWMIQQLEERNNSNKD